MQTKVLRLNSPNLYSASLGWDPSMVNCLNSGPCISKQGIHVCEGGGHSPLGCMSLDSCHINRRDLEGMEATWRRAASPHSSLVTWNRNQEPRYTYSSTIRRCNFQTVINHFSELLPLVTEEVKTTLSPVVTHCSMSLVELGLSRQKKIFACFLCDDIFGIKVQNFVNTMVWGAIRMSLYKCFLILNFWSCLPCIFLFSGWHAQLIKVLP